MSNTNRRVGSVMAVAGLVTGVSASWAQHSPEPHHPVAEAFRLGLSPRILPGFAAGFGGAGSRLALQQEESEGSKEAAMPARNKGYREISDFFNVREAYANVSQGEWELELEGGWLTGIGDDDFLAKVALYYGLADTTYFEVELVPARLGDGGNHGAGDLALLLFHQFFSEMDDHPAVAAWLESRFPTGDGSSGIDVDLHVNVTKTLAPDIRGHFEGIVESANGGPGDEGDGRRPFQWGAGLGVDYQTSDTTIYTLNYLNHSSEENGRPNTNVLEIGSVCELAPNRHFKVLFDIGLDGHEETPDFGAKIQWTMEW